MLSPKIKAHNVNDLMLIRNKDFYFVNENDKKIFFQVPNFEDYLSDISLSVFLSMLELDKSKFEGMNINNNLDLVLNMIKNQLYLDDLMSTLHKYIMDLRIDMNGLFVNNEILIAEEFDFIVTVWKISLGLEKLEVLTKEKDVEPELDEFEKRIRDNESKINKIKQKVESESLELDKVVIAVMKEFNLKIEEVLSLNLFTVFWYYVHALKINNYRVETIAFGNGLIKKHKYFIE